MTGQSLARSGKTTELTPRDSRAASPREASEGDSVGEKQSRQSPWRRHLKYVLHAAVLVGVVVAGMKYINGDEFWRAVHRFNWSFAPVVLLLSIAYVLVKGWRFVTQLRQLVPARRRVILKAYVAGQACSVLPGGIAARPGLLKQVGIPVEDSAASSVLSSCSDFVVLILCSILSALWFEAARKPAAILLVVLTVLSVLLGIEATRTWLVGIVEWLLGKVKLLDLWRRFLDSAREIAKPRMFLGAIGNAVLAAALMVVALDLTVRGVGAAVPYSTLLLAFTLPSMLGRISALPAGVGVTEAGMIGILDATPGVTLDQAAAAAILFRVGTVFFAALVGGAVYLFLWRGAEEKVR